MIKKGTNSNTLKACPGTTDISSKSLIFSPNQNSTTPNIRVLIYLGFLLRLAVVHKKKCYFSDTLQGTNISPQKWHFEDDFPFPQVGYVNFLEGIFSSLGFQVASKQWSSVTSCYPFPPGIAQLYWVWRLRCPTWWSFYGTRSLNEE